MFKLAIPRRVSAGALGVIVVLGTAGCSAATTTTADTTQATHPPAAAAVHALVVDARSARDQHDTRTLNRIRARLIALMGTADVREIQASYRQVLANLAAADAGHDAQARARYRAQLRALCDPAGVTSVLVSCDAALARHGD
jgi:hypothetical protein